MFHQLTIAGNVGKDAEARYTENGDLTTSFSVAADNSYTKKDGTKVNKTVWFRAQAYGKLAEICQKYIKKGGKVLIIGKLMSDDNGNPKTWISTTDGLPRASFDISISYLRMLGGPRNEEPEEVNFP